MTRCLPVGTLLIAALLALPFDASALTMNQVAAMCAAYPGECSEHPLVQAYVGGALDLIATLDEQTEYLEDVYCKQPAELFDVPAIIRYLEAQRGEYAERNAMLLVIRYLEDNGGC